MYSHAPVESAKAINLHDLSSDWINLKEKEQIPYKFFSFQGMFSLCAVKTCGKHTVETRLNTASCQFFPMVLLVSDCRFGVSPVNYPDPDPFFFHNHLGSAW